MAKNYGSAVFQVKKALQAVFTPGESRHAGKQDGTAGEHIYSIGAMKTYLSCDIVFARWVRAEFGEKFIGGVTPEMVERFIRNLHERDMSHATINKYVAAITKLDAGLRAVGWRSGDAPELVPVDLYSRHADARPAPYSAEQARQIIDHLRRICPDRRLALAAEAAWRGGLRISELAGLRVTEISETGWTLNLDGHATKGGRPRVVPLNDVGREFFSNLRAPAQRRDGRYVFRDHKGLPRELQRWLNRACRELGIGHSRVHDFRAAYANQLYERLIAAGASDRQARRDVAAALGHGRIDVLRHYLMGKSPE
jgi:integrase